jgi:hypothetical protein
MYARVIQNFLGLLIRDGQVNLNLDDAIIKGMCITHDGNVIQEQTRQVMSLGPLEVPVARAPAEPGIPAETDSGPRDDLVKGDSTTNDSETRVVVADPGGTHENRAS